MIVEKNYRKIFSGFPGKMEERELPLCDPAKVNRVRKSRTWFQEEEERSLESHKFDRIPKKFRENHDRQWGVKSKLNSVPAV